MVHFEFLMLTKISLSETCCYILNCLFTKQSSYSEPTNCGTSIFVFNTKCMLFTLIFVVQLK